MAVDGCAAGPGFADCRVCARAWAGDFGGCGAGDGGNRRTLKVRLRGAGGGAAFGAVWGGEGVVVWGGVMGGSCETL